MQPRKRRNMPPGVTSWRSACACSNRSSPTAAHRRLRRSRRIVVPRLDALSRSGTKSTKSTKSTKRHSIKESDLPTSLLIFFMIVVGIPVFGGIAVSAFQRWLQHKEKMSELLAHETAEK